MIAVDTNIIVRLLTRDDERQFSRARGAFQCDEVLIPESVLLETVWVLQHAYCFAREEIAGALKTLCGQSNVHLSNPGRVAQVIEWYHSGMDFADAFHLASSRACESLLTFDERFMKKASKLTNCKVVAPGTSRT